MAAVGDEAAEDNGAKPASRKAFPDYNKYEHLAIGRAARAASVVPQQDAAVLRAKTRDLYKAKVVEVATEVGWPVVMWHARGVAPVLWTAALSAEHRTMHGCLWKRWNEERNAL